MIAMSAAEKAIRCLPGVMMAEGDLTLSRLQVDFDPAKTSLEEIEEALAAAGYDVMENIASGTLSSGEISYCWTRSEGICAQIVDVMDLKKNM